MRQAELTREIVSNQWILDSVYCSPLSRCVRTADLISDPIHMAAIPHLGLTDIDYGGWTSLGVDEVWERWPQESSAWKNAPHTCRIPGGESLQDVAARAADALGAILHAHPRGAIAIVTHDSVLRVLLCHVMGLPLSSYWLFDPKPCGISVISHAESRFTIHSFNETQHLLNA
jgi:probable phosphoglycerate mutase